MSNLKMHKHVEHQVALNSTHGSDLPNIESTRNNSDDEVLLCEDITLEALEFEGGKVDDEELAEGVPKYTVEEEISKDVPKDVNTQKNLESPNCYFCQVECNDKNSLKIHYNDQYNSVYVECEMCEYTAFDLDVLKQHKMKHTGSSIFQCSVCSRYCSI